MTAEAFARVDPERLLAAQTAVTGKGNPVLSGHAFHITVDGDVLPDHPGDLLVDGASADVELLMGTNTDEYRLWFVPGGHTEKVGSLGQRLLLRKGRISPNVAKVYRAGRSKEKPGEVLGVLAADKLLWMPLNMLADARLNTGGAAATYMYEFGWPSPSSTFAPVTRWNSASSSTRSTCRRPAP